MPLVPRYHNLSDIELVERSQASDVLAYDELFYRYNARICLYLARRVGDDETGRDLAQETFIKAWQALPRLQGEKYFQGWLYRIATNVAKDHLRRQKLIRWLPWEEHEEFIRIGELLVEGPEGNIEDQDLLKFALMQVPPNYRQCVILQIVEERSQREIAALLSISESSVSTYVRRGMERLRQVYFSLEHEHKRPMRGRIVS